MEKTYNRKRVKVKATCDFWNSLSFSMKKKYVNWIESAKKENTRLNRININLEKLKNKEKI